MKENKKSCKNSQYLLTSHERRLDMVILEHPLYDENPPVNDDVTVLNSGFCSVKPRFCSGSITRDYYLIHYCTNGKGTFITEESEYSVSKHNGFLIMPNMSTSHLADAADPWNICWVAFTGKKIEAYLRDANLDRNHLLFRYDQDDFLENCIKNIYNEIRNGKNVATIKGLFFLFLGRLIDNSNQKKPRPQAIPIYRHFDVAVRYINKNILTPIKIEKMSDDLQLDTSQLYRIFKKNTGMSPQRYITSRRICKACDILAKTELPIKDISKWLCFDYPSHFTNQFKKNTGLSPLEYRMKCSNSIDNTLSATLREEIAKQDMEMSWFGSPK